MFKLTKQVLIALLSFSGLLASIVNTPEHTKCLSLKNQQCMTQRTLVNLHPNEYVEWLRYYPLAVNLDRCMGSCNNLNDRFNRTCVPNKTDDLNLSAFDMVTARSESTTLTRHIPCKCKCKFDGRKCNSNQKWNNNKCRCEWKNPKRHNACEKDYI